MSTSEAGIFGLVEEYKEHRSVHKLMEEPNIVHRSSSEYAENEAVLTISHDSSYTGRAKHIEFCFLAIQDMVHRRETPKRFARLMRTPRTV